MTEVQCHLRNQGPPALLLSLFSQLFAVAFLMTQSKQSKNRKPDIPHPCFTPDLIINQSDVKLPSTTVDNSR